MNPLEYDDPEQIRAHLAAIVDSSDDAILSKTLDGIILSCNAAAEKLYGYSSDELVGRPLSILVPGDRKGELRQILAKIKAGERIDHYETRRVAKTGELIDISLTVSPIRDSAGNVTGASAIARNITEQKRLEARFRAAQKEAQAATRLKSEFLATMSHEIRTPMNGILGMTTLLLDTPLTSEQRQYVQTLRGSAEALLTIINDILDFSKIEAGKVELDEMDLATEDVVGDVADLLADQTHDKGVELVTVIANDVPPRLRGDAGRLRQILTNLVGNAVKFTQRGEILVKVSVADEDVDGLIVRFDVVDTGIGIPRDRQARLFDPFSQADASTTRTYGGSGLGLAISKRLVHLMGGDIGFESEPGEGSVFWFTVRLTPAVDPGDEQPRDALTGVRALVVDDNETSRRMLEHYLGSWGVRSTAVERGADALEALRTAASVGEPYDVVLIDAEMPQMTGAEVARSIAADPAVASTAVVLLTSPTSGKRRMPSAAGVALRIAKPIRPSDLYVHVAAAVGRGPGPDMGVARLATLSEAGTASGERVLVAEDNPVNQRVTVAMLMKIGYRADVVSNGLEVLDALERVPYAAVLMDCEMPELDGYEATRAIRGREGPERHTPIIAMTASALRGDRERAIAAGMDDYISKPTRFEDLAAVLRRWVGAEVAEGGAAPSGSSDGPPEAPIDPQTWSELRDLGRRGGPDVLREILAAFLQESTASVVALREACIRWDGAVVHAVAHRLKGSAANVGARRMASICEELESLARSGEPAQAEVLVDELETEFERVRVACERELAAERA